MAQVKTVPYEPVLKCTHCGNWFYSPKNGIGPSLSACHCWDKTEKKGAEAPKEEDTKEVG